ncbi:subtilisin-like protein [Marasmius fiardii PR-910]|nr:subtilisin-like protein [Marasmius fiardii PR-910]
MKLLSSLVYLASYLSFTCAIPLTDATVSNATWSSLTKRAPVQGSTFAWELARIGQNHMINTFGANGNDNAPKTLQSLNWGFKRDPTWGTNVLVYVIDTGVRGSHTELNGRVEAGFTLQTLGNIPANQDTALNHFGHGVASLIAGQRVGVAPAARIVPIRIFGDGDSAADLGATPNVIWGINTAVADFNARPGRANLKAVINISYILRDTAEARTAVTNAITQGIHVVYAAGNEGQNQCPNPANPNPQRVAQPGQITVGAVDAFDEYRFNFGPCIDILAPGAQVRMASAADDTSYLNDDGTSFAAPLVSGVIASILSQPNPPASPQDMKTLLTAAAPVAGRQYSYHMAVQGGTLPAGTTNIFLQSYPPSEVQQ